MTKDFLIVEFPEETGQDESVPMAIISDDWTFYDPINDRLHCYWPSYIKREDMRKITLKEHFEIDKQKCTICPINVKCKTSSYEKAAEKLRRLENFSSVSQSDQDDRLTISKERPAHKRESRINTKYLDYLMSSEDEAPSPPPLPKYNKKFSSLSQRVQDEVRSTWRGELKTHRTYSDSCMSPLGKETPSLKSPNPNQTIENQLSTLAGQRISTQLQVPSDISSTASVEKCSSVSQERNLENLLQTKLKQLEDLTQAMNYMCSLINHENADEVIVGVGELENFSSNTEEELNIFNGKLSDPQFFSKQSAMLQLIGGKDLVDNTRRILTKLISNDLALQCNWLGRNNKIAFEKFGHVVKLILVTVRKNPLCKNTTENEITTVVKQWFRTAGDRDGGRSRRKK